MSAKKPTQTCTVLFDGSCEVCTVAASHIKHSSQRSTFKLTDITKQPLPKHLNKEAVNKEIHVIDENGKVHKHIDAILLIIAEYPKWRWLAKIGRWPGIYQILWLIYSFVSANRHFLLGTASRIYWVKTVTVIALLVGMLFSVPLWVGERGFPELPIVGLFSALPPWIFTLTFITLIGSLFCALVFSQPQKYLWVACGALTFLILGDQTRLQPWVYQYGILLGVLSLFSWQAKALLQQQRILNICRFILVAIYFWAGLFKLNPHFFTETFPWMIEPIVDLFGGATFVEQSLMLLGAFAPFIEIAIGICLLFPKFRIFGLLLAAGMIGFILYSLGPFGHNWNSVVWPWNIAMLALAILLFAKTPTVSAKSIVWSKHLVHRFIVILFGVLPILHLFNIWDTYPSFSLYSGNTNSAVVVVDDNSKQHLPSEAIAQSITVEDETRLNVTMWAMTTLNVPAYPEIRTYQQLHRTLCESSPTTMIIAPKDNLWRKQEVTTLTCK